MKMEMVHRLSRHDSVVRENVESLKIQPLYERSRDFAEGRHDALERCRGELQEFRAVPLWYNERVAEMDRMDIEDGDRVLVFIDDLGWLGSIDDPAKDTVGHVHLRCRASDLNLSKKGPKVKEPGENCS